MLTLLFAAGLLFAQEKAPEPAAPAGPREAAIIQVKTLTGDSFDRLIRILSVFGVPYKGDSQLRTIVVYAPKDVVDQMRHVVEQLDQPGSEAAIGRNIDMTLTLLHCGGTARQSEDAVPSDTEAVLKQIRATTTCKDPRLWDTIPVRLQEGKRSSFETRLPGPAGNNQRAIVNIAMQPDAVYRKDQARYIRFAGVTIELKVPITTGSNSWSWQNLSINTAGDFREGQKTVLGKVSGTGDDDSVFAVIALKVLD
ncbi:MAG: hypothetical protein KGN84_01210 [Acidobacteriota bacterium]|nr:hypothetical protein [Acidobacteriota bacterium]